MRGMTCECGGIIGYVRITKLFLLGEISYGVLRDLELDFVTAVNCNEPIVNFQGYGVVI